MTNSAPVWKKINTAFKGRSAGGSYSVEGRFVRVKTALGEKAAPFKGVDAAWVAWRLLREMAAEGKA